MRTLAGCVLLMAGVSVGFAQDVVKGPAFEVVSIRPEPAAVARYDEIAATPDGWRMTHGTMLMVLLSAYVPTTSDAAMYTVSTLAGVPDWMRSEAYSIDARVPEADLAAWQKPATQTPLLHSMLQTMLAERCKLVVHRSTKEVTVYSLVVGKGGAKLKAAVSGEAHPGAVKLPGGGEFLPSNGSGMAAFYAAPVSALTVVLSNFAGRPVEDRTGLTGLYDMSFRRPRPGGPAMEPEAGVDPPPTIFDVVESFGLKLVPAKSIVETLVVDRVERPSEN